MRPRNPGTGHGDAKQLQSWIAGPDPAGNAVILLVNYGPNLGQAGFDSNLAGRQTVFVTSRDLGIEGMWEVRDAWAKRDLGLFRSDLAVFSERFIGSFGSNGGGIGILNVNGNGRGMGSVLMANLDEGESIMLTLRPLHKWKALGK